MYSIGGAVYVRDMSDILHFFRSIGWHFGMTSAFFVMVGVAPVPSTRARLYRRRDDVAVTQRAAPRPQPSALLLFAR
jgi:hypothetical protein